MALWEYKVITSGPHGFASPTLLEAHLNALGKDEWEIIHFQPLPNNPLAFNGLARRSTMRDWSPPEIAVAAPPRPSAYEPAPSPALARQAQTAAASEEKPELPAALAHEVEPAAKSSEKTLRTFRDTERDLDPDAEDEPEDDWDNWEEAEDDLPTFFEAIKPHLRRNQKGPGQSVAVDYLAKRWDQREPDLIAALKECGFTIPETEEADPDYFEFEGDLYWVNRNNRGQLFINTREKPRPVFRTAPAKKLAADDPAAAELVAERAAEKAEIEKRRSERAERQERQQNRQNGRDNQAAPAESAGAESGPAAAPAEPAEPGQPLPAGPELLDKLRPMMRRNRRGPGYSGSVGFLSRALKQREADLTAALTAAGLTMPASPSDKPVYAEIGNGVYWLNKDNRGGIWINGREKKEGAPKAEASGAETEQAAASQAPDAPESAATPSADGSSASAPASATAELPLSSEAAPETPEAEAPGDSETNSDESDEGPAETSGDTGPINTVLSGVRVLLKANKRGSGVSGEVGFLARTLEKSEDDFLASLTGAGLVVPADSEQKPTFVEQGGEIFWLNKNSSDGSLWVNAKAAKSARKGSSGGRTRAPRKRKTGETESAG